MQIGALVLGAGRGERFRASGASSAAPKALALLAGRSLLAHSLRALAAAASVDVVLPVLSQDGLDRWPAVEAECGPLPGLRPPVLGGAERIDSVRCGLAGLGPSVDWVAVHDAARPLVRADEIDRVVAAARGGGAATLACPVSDTIHRATTDRTIAETPDRAGLWRALTPQVFRRDWLEAALAAALRDGLAATDDAGLVARQGHPVALVAAGAANPKITTAADLRAAEGLLADGVGGPGGAS